MKDKVLQSHLSNGMPVFFMPTKDDLFTISYSIQIGPNYENELEKGFSHFLEHILFARTKAFKNKNDINKYCDDHGLIYNGVTYHQLVSLYVVGHKTKISEMIYFLEQICCFPLFDENDIQQEKSVIFQEIDYYKDNISNYRFNLNLETFFVKGYHDALGTKESLSEINVESIKSFYNLRFRANYGYISFVGNVFDKDIIFKLNCSAFTSFSDMENNYLAKMKRSKTREQIIKYSNNNTVYVSYMYDIPKIKTSNFALSKLADLIIGDLNSSLMKEIIREREGLSYVTGSATLDFPDDQILFLVADVEKNNVDKTRELIENEIVEKAKNLTDEKLLSRAIEYIKTNDLLRFQKITTKLDKINRNQAVFGKYLPQKQILSKVEKTSLEELNLYLKKYLVDPTICIIDTKE